MVRGSGVEGDERMTDSTDTHEEICKGCVFANWIDASEFWNNSPHFAFCKISEEESVDFLDGECESKVESSYA